ncbi:SAM-dependent methyltransferase [Actinocrinis sp.]|uniref:SAM-dependent methyltransferase n=1 Tax=Actinocrinis sp. TaxID=1920516 RepID=UPI002DDCE66F|nr:SAM-dependent methyltransferase [Actinocrinis sp.]
MSGVTVGVWDEGNPVARIDSSRPHSARVYNYLLGGKDNYPVDREAAEVFLSRFLDAAVLCRMQRRFLGRAVQYLVAEAGVRQFLDIGTGLPTADNTHQVAQRVDPTCRVVYVDNDPLVLVHAQALLTSTPQGACDYVRADVREPEHILSEAARTLDFTQPIALMLLAVLGQIPDTTGPDDPTALVPRLLQALPAGSYLVISDATNIDESFNEAEREYNNTTGGTHHLRSPQQIAALFTGLDLVAPGIVPITQWRPEPLDIGTLPVDISLSGVARKP